MNELALFAGAGGGILGGTLTGFKTVCAVEWEPYCQAVLLARQADGLLERFPIWDDVRTFQGADWRGKVDVVTAGFPCQPFSSAGKRKGTEDERNGWPDTIRIIREVRPSYALLENVPGLLNWDGGSYFRQILSDLSESGFDARWKVISAAEVGAPHKRDRLWILAYSNPDSIRFGSGEPEINPTKTGIDAQREPARLREVAYTAGTRRTSRAGKGQSGGCGEVANAGTHPTRSRQEPRSGGNGDNQQHNGNQVGDESSKGGSSISDSERLGRIEVEQPERGREEAEGPTSEAEHGCIASRGGWWAVEPALGRVAHGVAHRVDRLKAIGNGQVPAVAARAWNILSSQFNLVAPKTSKEGE